ncbi:MAG TPA: response regulator [Telmatospirillum sp.]|nr:response regulator [Telmatospirillum sp.]
MTTNQSDSGPHLQALKLLLAEDNVVNQKVTVALLSRYGHQVQVAEDGLEALRAVETERFDAVLMDVQMPNMDGLEATRAIRGLPDGKGRLPIIALTAGSGDDDAARCLAAGMDGIVGKPFDTRKFLAVLEQCLQSRRKP